MNPMEALRGAIEEFAQSEGLERVEFVDAGGTTHHHLDIRETTPDEKEAAKTRAKGYTGRGPTGRLRNIVQMDDDKLIRTHEAVKFECNSGREDYEALEKLEEQLRYRTWLQGKWWPWKS